ncbi:hypothetical protein D3C78_1658430 [compost metagenome]
MVTPAGELPRSNTSTFKVTRFEGFSPPLPDELGSLLPPELDEHAPNTIAQAKINATTDPFFVHALRFFPFIVPTPS